MKLLYFLLVVLLIAASQPAYSWGRTGHRIVAEIAQNHLSRKAKRAVEALIGPAGLPSVSVWADEIRSDPDWGHADPWHYVTIEDDQTYKTAAKNPDGDVVEAMRRMEAVLRDKNASQKNKREALKFLVHFVGDVHQPLHVGRGEDRGGNSIDVRWFGRSTNLHRVWDTELVDYEELSYTEFAEMLDHLSPTQIKAWQGSDYLDWAMESKSFRDKVYEFGEQREPEKAPYLGYDYIYRNAPVVKQRLAQGGVRLAGLLNDIFK